MEIDSAHPSLNLIKTDIVESLEASSLYTLELVIWNQEMLLPSHENEFLLPPIVVVHGVYKVYIALCVETERSPCWKSRPVRKISLVTGSPRWVPCSETVLLIRATDDLAREEGG